jgi:hypothetical protein
MREFETTWHQNSGDQRIGRWSVVPRMARGGYTIEYLRACKPQNRVILPRKRYDFQRATYVNAASSASRRDSFNPWKYQSPTQGVKGLPFQGCQGLCMSVLYIQPQHLDGSEWLISYFGLPNHQGQEESEECFDGFREFRQIAKGPSLVSVEPLAILVT